MAELWDPPSAEAAALLRQAAAWLLEHTDTLAAQLDAAVYAASPAPIRGDVALGAEAAASNRANLVHWATSVRDDPGAEVPAKLSPEVLGIARDATRRGADEMLVASYHASQNVALRYCMQLLFSMCDEPAILREALDVAARSIFAFVDDTVRSLQEQIARERAELTQGTHAERLEVVNLILDGAPISTGRASARLRYELDRPHTAAIVWSDPTIAEQRLLDRAVGAIARAASAPRPLTVIATASSIWMWMITPEAVDPARIRAALDELPNVRAAIGRTAGGIDGFRRSHLDALSTQRLMHDAPEALKLARFEDVAVVALAAQDVDRAAEFVAETLGPLAVAEPALRDTLRIHIREGFSPTRTARALYAHRNTVLNRLARAEQLLPEPLERRGIEVGLALEIAHWLGQRVAAGDH